MTSSSVSIRCVEPGCAGTYEDGYCNVCGAPQPVPRNVTGRTPAPAGPQATPGAPGAPGASLPPPVAPGGSPVAQAPLPPGDAGGVAEQRGSAKTSSSYRLASTPLGSARAGTGSRNTRRLNSSQRMRAHRLGAGITTVPSEPVVDPATAIMINPEVPEDRRFCPNCGKPVGRTRGDRPGRPDGFCPNCRNPFSFAPKLVAGDVVAGQYEVAGCLAHGGLGWIYLARDKNVSDRWVVLKGLLNSGDPDALAAAIAERQFLAQVEHPLIVEIYNFVMHEQAGYIVMEYVSGTSLKGILKERMRANKGRFDAIPVDQAIAYIVEVLPAFQYLHDLGLLYCDFKPDNIIQFGDAIKLIDLGGVRRVDDVESAIYGTIGYQAPEVAEVGPSIESDIYTIGRTLVSLAMEFRGNTTTYVSSLPGVADTPLFQEYDSLYRLLAKACALNPADRFSSADELRVQLLGVLREAVASRNADRPSRHSTASQLFEAPVVESDRLDWRSLPELKVDDADPQATWLDSISVDQPREKMTLLLHELQPSIEVRLATAHAALLAAEFDTSARFTAALLNEDPWEWRAIWIDGLSALATDDATTALGAFNAVYGQLPGELAPKLALALACEQADQPDVAEQLYLTCLRTDANYTAPAAFGLARIRSGQRISASGGSGAVDLAGAISALDMVPVTSRSFVSARRQRAALLLENASGLDALSAALSSVDTVSLDPKDRALLRVRVLQAALDDVNRNGPQSMVMVGGVRADATPLRDAVERAYRDLALMAEDHTERIELVDQANSVRRWTWR